MIHGDAGESAFWGMVRYGQVGVVHSIQYKANFTSIIVAFGLTYQHVISQAHGDDPLCRQMILTILGETNGSTGNQCLKKLKNECSTTQARDIGLHAQTATRVVSTFLNLNEPCTLNQVVTKCKWMLNAENRFFADFL